MTAPSPRDCRQQVAPSDRQTGDDSHVSAEILGLPSPGQQGGNAKANKGGLEPAGAGTKPKRPNDPTAAERQRRRIERDARGVRVAHGVEYGADELHMLTELGYLAAPQGEAYETDSAAIGRAIDRFYRAALNDAYAELTRGALHPGRQNITREKNPI